MDFIRKQITKEAERQKTDPSYSELTEEKLLNIIKSYRPKGLLEFGFYSKSRRQWVMADTSSMEAYEKDMIDYLGEEGYDRMMKKAFSKYAHPAKLPA